ncbi:response regulator transcription factor [Novosphingobium sp.]|uniref:response regulator transcription factor n=1 Tax=Novosphingobium sp. TaxID=1874826 RepID=UPI0033405AFD
MPDTPARPLHVLLIEDDPFTAAAIVDALAAAAITATHVTTGEQGVQRSGDATIDAIVIDRMLPGISGIEAIARMRAAGVDKPVLILSALGRSDHRIEGLDQGADDYLAKPFEPAELIARVRALCRRAQSSASTRQSVLIHADIALHIESRTAHRAGRPLRLSPKEFDLLRYLMENAGETVTRAMLLRHVWNLNFDPQTNVIDVNLVRLRRKLEAGFADSCLETVRGQGYRLGTPRDTIPRDMLPG